MPRGSCLRACPLRPLSSEGVADALAEARVTRRSRGGPAHHDLGRSHARPLVDSLGERLGGFGDFLTRLSRRPFCFLLLRGPVRLTRGAMRQRRCAYVAVATRAGSATRLLTETGVAATTSVACTPPTRGSATAGRGRCHVDGEQATPEPSEDDPRQPMPDHQRKAAVEHHLAEVVRLADI